MTSLPSPYAPPGTRAEQEEGERLRPRFDAQGLLTAVVMDADTAELLMVAHMNADALERTLRSGEAVFWSRSRQALWRKGETSGQTLAVVEARVDCDQDAVLLNVRVGGDGGCCHTGRRTCFYRRIELGGGDRLIG